jgi:hypothetical protein
MASGRGMPAPNIIPQEIETGLLCIAGIRAKGDKGTTQNI